MRITHEILTANSLAQTAQAQAQAQAAQAQAQAAAQATREATREAAREQAQQMKEQAQQLKEQAQTFKEQLKEQIQASIEAARAAEQGIPLPPTPPLPPDFGSHMPSEDFPQIPQQAVEIVSILGMTLVFCVVGFPIARAFARWLDRRGTTAAASPDISNRLQAIEQAVESVAVEVERISEGQRFTTRVLSERSAEPVSDFLGRERDAVHVGLPPDSGPGAPVNARRS